jgi:murein DD-endopeptidase MepM/ murein hydrolase activator NlpD
VCAKYVPVDKLIEFIEQNAIEIEPDQPPPPPPPPDEPGVFKLVWPTEHKVVTQWYGVNRHIYEQFGLPGHEGLDMRAPNGSNVVAAAEGKVYRVDNQGNYGIQVRIEHERPEGKFKTIYAHLQEPRVSVNDHVSAGDLVGLADNTGYSSGAHLHFTLKREGIGSDSFMPHDIINPVPYFRELWPGDGWQVLVGGNLRSKPRVADDTVIRYLGRGPTVQAVDFANDWWKITLDDGTGGWFWQPGYKLAAV